MRIVKAFTRSKTRSTAGPTVPPGRNGLVWLGLDGPLDRSRVGGKGAGLGRLATLGVPVPPTLILPVEVHRTWLQSGQSALPAGWRDDLIRTARQLGDRLAIRSSAVEEDGERSFAGVHLTELGVAPEDVPAAVVRVWQSIHSPTAVAYGPASAMAVVLQPMLEPDCAGVVFSIDPRTGSWREMVVEAVAGVGEALVSGRASPQWFVVRRPRPWPRSPLRRKLRMARKELVPQEVRWRIQGGTLRAVPNPRPGPLLSDTRVLELASLVLRVEAGFDEPVDVEWAWARGRFVLLQARSLTHRAVPEVTDVLWTRRFLGERFPTPPTEMTWSLLAPLFTWFIGYPRVADRFLGGGPPVQRFGGHPYLNVTVFRHLLFKWPGAPPPSFIVELLPRDEADAARKRFRIRPDWPVYRGILATTIAERRWRRFAWNPRTNVARWNAFAERLEADEPELRAPIRGPVDGLDRVRRYQACLREYLGIHLCSLLFANLGYQLLDGAIASWLPPGPWLARLAVCPPGNHTLAANLELARLARGATPEDLESLAEGKPTGTFASELAVFLETYGHRAEASWEVFSTRWAHDPRILVPLLRGATAPPSQGLELVASRRDALAHVAGWRQSALAALIDHTRAYLLLRENQRFAFERLTAGLQDVLLEIGTWLPLEDPADVRHLTLEQLNAWVHGGGSVPLRAVPSPADTHPPPFIRGSTPVDSTVTGQRLEGLGISPGRARGRVRIVRTLADGIHLRDGEILVAPALDPSWTPLLPRAGALLLELGSLLSHGAVVAREYGVPGVVNLEGVTRVLTDGMEVTVDGARGTVWVHDAPTDGSP